MKIENFIYVIDFCRDMNLAGLRKVGGDRYRYNRNIVLANDSKSGGVQQTLTFDVWITPDGPDGEYMSVYHTYTGILILQLKTPQKRLADAKAVVRNFLDHVNTTEWLRDISGVPRINELDVEKLEIERLAYENKINTATRH